MSEECSTKLLAKMGIVGIDEKKIEILSDGHEQRWGSPPPNVMFVSSNYRLVQDVGQ